jgi:dTMP kinase
MNNTGRLIVFEGADAAGKSAISSSILQDLRDRGIITELFTFPGKIPRTLGEIVYRIHHDEKRAILDSVTPTALQALHIAAHLDAIESRILPLLANGTSVVLDRYWWSTFVYGAVDGIDRAILSALIEVEKIVWGTSLPSVLFYVTRRTPLRSEPMGKWRHWNETYRELVTSENNKYPIVVVDNEGTLPDAISTILASPYLK